MNLRAQFVFDLKTVKEAAHGFCIGRRCYRVDLTGGHAETDGEDFQNTGRWDNIFMAGLATGSQ